MDVFVDANGLVRCFQEKKKQWGFSQLISYKDFYDPSNGFLVYDSCAFGAEVFVVQSSIVLERPPDQYPKQCPNIFTWDVKDFTKKDNWIYIESENFEVGGMAWYVKLNYNYKLNYLWINLMLLNLLINTSCCLICGFK